jgi:hypothetical protein
MSKVEVTIIADNELGLSIPSDNGGDADITRKLVSLEGGPADKFYTYDGLLEAASYLHDVPALRSRYKKAVRDLGWVLYNSPEDPDRFTLVTAMQVLMTEWTLDCSRDETCLPPPSREFLKDPAARKMLRSVKQLQERLKEAALKED